MATAPKTNKFADDTTANDDLPDEYSNDGAQSNTSTQSTMTSSFSWDAFAGVTGNAERDNAERKRLDPPGGDWIKRDRWECQPKFNDGDYLPGDICDKINGAPKGRFTIAVFGKPEARTVDGDEYQPVLFVRVSPDLRYKQDDNGELTNTPDMAYKLWLRAKDLYLALNKEKTDDPRKIAEMLAEEEYKINTMKPSGSGNLITTGLKTKEIRRRERR